MSKGGTTTRVCDGLAVALLVLAAAVALAIFRDYGLGWDDYTHSQYGDLLLSFYRSGFSDRRAFSFVNLYMYGGGFDMAAALLAKVLPFGLFETRRLLGAVVGLLGLLATWRLGRRVGGPLAGLLALVLLAACPLYFGHMFMNPKDAPFAAAMAFLLLMLVRLFERFPRPAPVDVVLFGLALGLTIGSRVIGGVAAIDWLAALAVMVASDARALGLREAGRRSARFILSLLAGVPIAYVVMGLIWPWSVLAPLNPLRAVAYFSTFFEKPWKELFEGVLLAVPDMPRTYVPTFLLLQLPEIFLVLGVAGLAGALLAQFRGDVPPQRRALLLLLATAVIFPVALTVATRPAMYNGIRHFVFLLPALAALAGLAGAIAFQRLGASWRPARASLAGLFALGLALPLKEMAAIHPYEYTYFNVLAGGVPGADRRFMLDYWGLSFKQVSEQLLAALAQRHEAPPGGRRWRIAVCGPHPPAEVALGPRFETTWNPKGADFAMTLGEFYCARLDAPVLAEIDREGVMYARVYDIRGRSISNLFTIPPVN
ncbi:MAG TPA: glycosyltransferase family 39 protein [Xanthobacteraceae bacterium]|nr:glycosyltransferase family 39 protein [Xanthobacteraceae bacterium]